MTCHVAKPYVLKRQTYVLKRQTYVLKRQTYVLKRKTYVLKPHAASLNANRNNISVHMPYIYSHYRMKLHEFFFFLQAHAGIFFSSSISCMNFFFGSDTPLPGYLMVHPLSADCVIVAFICTELTNHNA